MHEPLRALLEHAGDGATSPAELEEGVTRARAELADTEERLRELLEKRRVHLRVGDEEAAARTKRKIARARRDLDRWRAARRKLEKLRDERTETSESPTGRTP